MSDSDWADRRRRAIDAQAAALAARAARENDEAAALVKAFADEASRRGLPATRLVATAFNGRSRYRTSLRGWYIHPRRTFAVGVDGNFYRLTVPVSPRSRVFGARIPPDPPPLVIGAGGGDGESIALETLLRQRLPPGPPPALPSV